MIYPSKKRPIYYPDTGEYRFNGRWYDSSDPDDMDALSEAVEDQENYDMEYGDWLYHYRKDEGL
jgi:hypothetical protein